MGALGDLLNDFYNEDSVATEIIVGIVICIMILILYYFINYIIKKVNSSSKNTPVIYKGLKAADIPVTINQDPNLGGSVTVYRSQNEKHGIEFSYSVWLWIDTKSWNTTTKWKHVFHKGPMFNIANNLSNSEPSDFCNIQSPGLWLDGKTNKIRLYMNTFGVHNEYIEVDNIPVKKWICVIYTQSGFNADLYINGRLKERKELRTLPRQNYANVHLNQDDGYQGYLSHLKYYNYALNSSEIHDITEKGPSLEYVKQSTDVLSSVKIDNEIPYLSNRWWNNSDLTIQY